MQNIYFLLSENIIENIIENITPKKLSRYLIFLFLWIFTILLPTQNLIGQILDETNSGKIYIITFPQVRTHVFDSQETADLINKAGGSYIPPLRPSHTLCNAYVHIYSSFDQTIDIKQPNDTIVKVNLIGKQFTRYPVLIIDTTDYPAFVDTASQTFANRSIRIESTYPIVVYCEIQGTNGAEAWTAVPAESWGNEYYLNSFPDDMLRCLVKVDPTLNYKYDNDYNIDFVLPKYVPAPAEAVINALDSGTRIDIYPSHYSWRNVGEEFFPTIKGNNATLEMNDAFLIQSNADTIVNDLRMKTDISGTKIVSNKPIGVISGNTRSTAGYEDADIHGMLRNSYKNLLMEALTPVNAHGTEFVYLPTNDNKFPYVPVSNYPSNGMLRMGELVRLTGSSQGRTNITYSEVTAGPAYVNNNSSTPTSRYLPEDFSSIANFPFMKTYVSSVAIKTSQPAQAFQAPLPVYTGPEKSEGFYDVSYIARAPFMTELVPREQWISFAPYFNATYVNVVTDSIWKNQIEIKPDAMKGRPVALNFTYTVPGTSYVWATMLLDQKFAGPGFIRGVNGAKFAAYCYGFSDGGESRAANSVSGVYNYTETTATAYGYPVAPSRVYLAPPDSIELKTYRDDCGFMVVEAKIVNPNPSGFRAINMLNDTNVTFNMTTPNKYFRVIGADYIRFSVRPTNIRRDGVADIVITDRTGHKKVLHYSHQGFELTMIPNRISFDSSATGKPYVTIKNNSYKTIIVTGVATTNIFETDTISATLPDTLEPGESIKVQVAIYPTDFYQEYKGQLIIYTNCDTFNVPLHLNKRKFPCIYIDDYDFGTVPPGKLVRLGVDICNYGEGILHFRNVTPNGQQLFSFPNGSGAFVIDPADLQVLQSITLAKMECKKVFVSFQWDSLGTKLERAKCYSNATCIRDTPWFRSKVIQAAPAITGTDFGPKLTTAPVSACAKNKTPGQQNVAIWNTSNGPYTVASFELLGQDAKDSIFVFAKRPRPVIEVGDIIRGEDTSSDNTRYQEILFYPKEEKDYSCKARMISTAGDTVETTIRGRGITAHVAADNLNMGMLQYKGLYYSDYVNIRALPKSPLKIIGVELKGDPAFSFEPLYKKPSAKDPIFLDVGDVYQVPVRFKSNEGGMKTAYLCVSTDLHSLCEDSCATITAELPLPPPINKIAEATMTGLDFKDILLCDMDSGMVTITNTGELPLVIKQSSLSLQSKSISAGNFADTKIYPKEKMNIPLYFKPILAQSESTILYVDCFDSNGVKVITAVSSNLTGKAHEVSAVTAIDKYFNGAPSDSITIPIKLEKPVVGADITSFIIDIQYEPNSILLKDINESNKSRLTNATLLDGWDITIVNNVLGKLRLELTAKSGKRLSGAGTLLNLDFDLFFAEKLMNKISYTIEQLPKKCVLFSNTSGYVVLDTICGSRYRLIELTNSNYALKQNKPNPFNPSTDIEFSLGLDGMTSLGIYNSIGEKVLVIMNEYLQAGDYRFTFNASNLPSGLYYYKLSSGTYSKTMPMVLQK